MCVFVYLVFYSLLLQTSSGVPIVKMMRREDEASVGSTPLAKQLSNQASDYASSPVKTKTVTGTLKCVLFSARPNTVGWENDHTQQKNTPLSIEHRSRICSSRDYASTGAKCSYLTSGG